VFDDFTLPDSKSGLVATVSELTVHCKHPIHGIKASVIITYDQVNNR
jgi:hypothetical protein